MSLCGDRKKTIHRINRIEGQIKGLRKMVEDDRDCKEVLKQIAASLGAIRALGAVVLEDHLSGCVSEAIRSEEASDELIVEVVDIFNKFVR